MTASLITVDGFALALDRWYEPGTHMWVLALPEPGLARIGIDPLGAQTSGTLAQVSLPVTGTELTAGRPFGELEAMKFVGPLVSPVSGTVTAANLAAVGDPGLIERDPFGSGWLIEAQLAEPGEPGRLLTDPAEISAWYAARIAEYRRDGVIAQ